MNMTNETPRPRGEAITEILERLLLALHAPEAHFPVLIRAALSDAFERGHATACAALLRERERLEMNAD